MRLYEDFLDQIDVVDSERQSRKLTSQTESGEFPEITFADASAEYRFVLGVLDNASPSSDATDYKTIEMLDLMFSTFRGITDYGFYRYPEYVGDYRYVVLFNLKRMSLMQFIPFVINIIKLFTDNHVEQASFAMLKDDGSEYEFRPIYNYEMKYFTSICYSKTSINSNIGSMYYDWEFFVCMAMGQRMDFSLKNATAKYMVFYDFMNWIVFKRYWKAQFAKMPVCETGRCCDIEVMFYVSPESKWYHHTIHVCASDATTMAFKLVVLSALTQNGVLMTSGFQLVLSNKYNTKLLPFSKQIFKKGRNWPCHRYAMMADKRDLLKRFVSGTPLHSVITKLIKFVKDGEFVVTGDEVINQLDAYGSSDFKFRI